MIFERDHLSRVICNIRIPIGTGEETGTAIFITKETNEVILLTASHVVQNINPQSYAILADDSGVPTKVLLSVLLGGATFINHPQADLAKATINVNGDNSKYLASRCFPFNQINVSTDLLSKDIELTTIGFPLGLGSLGARFTPLSFRTFVAGPSISLQRADNRVVCDFIILELPSVGGYSGGPVFDLGYIILGNMTQSKGKTILHGIVHGTISDPTGGKLAAITPCRYLVGWL